VILLILDANFTWDDLGNRVTLHNRAGNNVAYVANTANEYTAIGGQSVSPDGWHALVLLSMTKTIFRRNSNRKPDLGSPQFHVDGWHALVLLSMAKTIFRRISNRKPDLGSPQLHVDGWHALVLLSMTGDMDGWHALVLLSMAKTIFRRNSNRKPDLGSPQFHVGGPLSMLPPMGGMDKFLLVHGEKHWAVGWGLAPRPSKHPLPKGRSFNQHVAQPPSAVHPG